MREQSLKGGSFIVMLQAVSLPFWWKWFYYLLWECLFWATTCSVLLHNFKYLCHYNLKWKKRFLESTLQVLIFDKYLYDISSLLIINTALSIKRGFLHRLLIYWRNTFVNLLFLKHFIILQMVFWQYYFNIFFYFVNLFN